MQKHQTKERGKKVHRHSDLKRPNPKSTQKKKENEKGYAPRKQ
jgi:hypothetical protein